MNSSSEAEKPCLSAAHSLSVVSSVAKVLSSTRIVPEWLDRKLNYLRAKARRQRAQGELSEAQATELEAKYALERWISEHPAT